MFLLVTSSLSLSPVLVRDTHGSYLLVKPVMLDISQEKDCPEENVAFVERFLILIIDLEALLPTRR